MSLGRSLTLALIVGVILSAVLVFRFDHTGTESVEPGAVRPVPSPSETLSSLLPPSTAAPIADPISIFNALLLEKREFSQTAALFELAGRVSIAQLLDLIDAAGRITLPGERAAATGILYTRLVELDPALAVEHVRARQEPAREDWLAAVFRTWARMDMEAAISAAVALEPIDRFSAGRAILLSMEGAPRKAREAVARALGLSGRLQEIELLTLRRRLSADPEQDWQSALGEVSHQLRMQRLVTIAQTWARTDPLRVLAEAELLPPGNARGAVIRQVFSVWGAQDVEAALGWLKANPERASSNLLSVTLMSVAQWEPEQALELTHEFPLQEAAPAQSSIVFQWAANDPEAATAWALERADEDLRNDLISNIAQVYGQQAPLDALGWAKSLPVGLRPGALVSVISALTQSRPRIAAEEALTSSEEILPRVVSGWSREDPAAALGWSRANLNAEQLRAVEPGIVGRLARLDLPAARRAIEQIPTTDRRDMASQNAIRRVARNGTAADIELLYGGIADPRQREEIAFWLSARFEQQDPALAARFRAEVSQERLDRDERPRPP